SFDFAIGNWLIVQMPAKVYRYQQTLLGSLRETGSLWTYGRFIKLNLRMTTNGPIDCMRVQLFRTIVQRALGKM
ncbi:MAG: hypothetical protein KAR11_06370, partial [Phycisphaerae bacterium]|nr:hypothetical protein [Phycisphaerae bacterium]